MASSRLLETVNDDDVPYMPKLETWLTLVMLNFIDASLFSKHEWAIN